jgi:salicylate hydroxylase
MPAPRRAIILGLGVAGPLAALTLLQRTDLSVTIYELRAAPATIGGALNLSPNAVRQLHRLGFDVEHLGAPIPTILHQNSKGQRLAVYVYGGPNNPFAKPYTGRRVMRKDLLNPMIASLKPYEEADRARIVFSKKATGLEECADRYV